MLKQQLIVISRWMKSWNVHAKAVKTPFLLLLDEIEDPHNLGSILRTAECTGVHGVIIPKRRSASLTATVSKISAGAVEYVPVARITNMAQTIDQLKEAGIWIAGADVGATQDVFTSRKIRYAASRCDWQ